MAYDAFLELEGVEGESTAKGMEKKIELYSFSFGTSNPTTIGSGSAGMSAGKASLSSFNVMKKTDKASAKLFQRCCEGMHFPKAKVTLRKAGGEAGQLPFLTYSFEGVFIESVQWSGSSGGDDSPVESVSFAFAKVAIEYKGQETAGGSLKVMGQASWDVTTVSSK